MLEIVALSRRQRRSEFGRFTTHIRGRAIDSQRSSYQTRLARQTSRDPGLVRVAKLASTAGTTQACSGGQPAPLVELPQGRYSLARQRGVTCCWRRIYRSSIVDGVRLRFRFLLRVRKLAPRCILGLNLRSFGLKRSPGRPASSVRPSFAHCPRPAVGGGACSARRQNPARWTPPNFAVNQFPHRSVW